MKNLPANRLSINIKEAIISEEEQDITIGSKNLGPAKRILADGPGKEYEFFFKSYGAYCVVNESFSMFQNDEERIGRLFCIYSKSHYLDFIHNNTLVDDIYDYDGELKHYAINCLDHIINIVTIDEPVIKRIC
ncbi:hypothetical protein [Mucilaginibacter sp. BT774]|uniref:hypothetical protein n=1 Tax=Mucilaginibacter sp. BT774 TaxID=3062276 RepID=UPI002677162D|nr:hypothetical protein [Mucilaginibacter sp. BT774]MDO3627374.1 hypothetical protein [Mucilaginibacter sp. BT774]